jgi:hypothetical protein
MNVLCKFGMHKWSKPKMTYLYGSNMKDFESYCLKCGKKKKWNEAIKE